MDADHRAATFDLAPLSGGLRGGTWLPHTGGGRGALPGVYPAGDSFYELDHGLSYELFVVGLRRQARTVHRRGPHQPDERFADCPGLLFGRNFERPCDGDWGLCRGGAVRRGERRPPGAPAPDRGALLFHLRLFGYDGWCCGDEDRPHLPPHERGHPTAGFPRWCVLLGRDAAGLLAGGDALQPDLPHGGRRPLRDPPNLRPEPLSDPGGGLRAIGARLRWRLLGDKQGAESPLLRQSVAASATVPPPGRSSSRSSFFRGCSSSGWGRWRRPLCHGRIRLAGHRSRWGS